MTRRSFHIATFAAALTAATMSTSPVANAQSPAILAEVYGQGVHAYYAGRHNDAFEMLSSAIDSGIRDPRAYYFRGIVAYQQGRPDEARADWTDGAEMEAKIGGGSYVGRSLSRFQGSARLELEQIRQKARLQASAEAATRSDTRMQELGVAPSTNPGAAPSAGAPAAAGNPTPAPVAPAAPAANDPFADDGAMATGEATVEKNDVLEGLGNPFEDDPVAGDAGDAAMPAAPAADNPFGAGGAPAAGGDDPFGAPAAGGADPFGGSDAGSDPFGGDPFGN